MYRTLTLASCLALTSIAGAETLKIMPMGDSITKGFHGSASTRGVYRLDLEQMLNEANVDFDFVGDHFLALDGLVDGDMQAVAGHRIQNMTADFAAAVAAHQPDIILVLAGTNNHWDTPVLNDFLIKYNDLLDMLHTNAPDARIIMSTVPKFGCCRDTSIYVYWTPEWVIGRNTVNMPNMNAAIAEVVGPRTYADCVDLYARLDPQSDLQILDWLHLNGRGHGKLAELFFNAILEELAPEQLHPCYVDNCASVGLDLNDNFFLDSCEADCDGDGLPNTSDDDGCAGTASADDADFDLDCDVDFIDLLEVLSQWGPCPGSGGCPLDLDGNAEVGFGDLVTLLAFWGGHDEGPACTSK